MPLSCTVMRSTLWLMNSWVRNSMANETLTMPPVLYLTALPTTHRRLSRSHDSSVIPNSGTSLDIGANEMTPTSTSTCASSPSRFDECLEMEPCTRKTPHPLMMRCTVSRMLVGRWEGFNATVAVILL
jgi:hypothetical protein